MAQIKKLMIQGIRSFAPADNKNPPQTIEFYSPLTLIVGQNGCGKTTIIEALKFAITSEYPPGTLKGGSFVHDPKLSSGYEVPALVKLELEDRNGDKIIMTRRLKATQKGKAGNISTSSTEASIRRTDKSTGTIQDISGKCADVKEEMCRLMGVSDAILNHVIFCHQEDSCWPLDEGKKVKERFDAIFNTTKYMKALDRLTIKDKAMASEISKLAIKFDSSQVMLKVVKGKQAEVETLTAELKAIADSIAKYKKETEEMDVKIKVLNEVETEFADAQAAVKYQNKSIQDCEEYIQSQTKLIKAVEGGSVTDLNRQIGNFKVTMKQKQQKLEGVQGELSSKENEHAALCRQKEKMNQEEGKFAQAEQDNRRVKSDLNKLMDKIVEFMKAMQENSQESTFTSSAITFLEAMEEKESLGEQVKPETALKAISSALSAKDGEDTKINKEYRVKESDMQIKIDKIKAQKTSLEKETEMKLRDIKTNNASMLDLRKRLNLIEGSGDTLVGLENDEEEHKEIVSKIESSGIIRKCNEEIQKLQNEIKDFQLQFEKIKGELEVLRNDKSITDKIQIHNKNKLQKQDECNEIMNRQRDCIKAVLGRIPEVGLGTALEKKIESLTEKINQKTVEQKVQMKKLSASEAEHHQVKKEVVKKRRELQQWQDQMLSILGGNLFEEVYSESTGELSEARKANYYNEAAQYLYEKYMQNMKSKSKNCCPLCKRDFQTKREGQELIRELENEVEKLKIGQPAEVAKVERLEKRNKTLAELKPVCDDKKDLEHTELPALERRLTELKDVIESLKESNQDLSDSVDILQSDLSMANSVKKDVIVYDQHMSEIKKLEDYIKKFEKERDPKAKKCSMSLCDAETEYATVEGSISTKLLEKDNKDALRARKNNELLKSRSELNRIGQEKLELKSEMQNRAGLEDKRKELDDANKQLQSTIDELKKQLPSLNSDINNAVSANSELRKEKEEKLKAIRLEAKDLEKQKDLLINLKTQNENFEQHKQEFSEKQKRFTQYKAKLDECEASLGVIKQEYSDLKDELSSSTNRHQELTISLSIRNKEEELTKLRQDMKAKEEALESAKRRGVGPEKRELVSQMHKIVGQINRLDGQRTEKKMSLSTLKTDLIAKDKPYHNAELTYKENLVNKVVQEKAKKDLRIYKAALEHAVLTFHHKKMETINRYLNCFWKRVYRGNDIDYIQIKTDNEDPNKIGDTVKVELIKNKRKTYNYRVVMIRRGIELDLRGRCSAGQKILASIIIRLALAQTFSTRCGVIALDEPTTNLDKRNIDSLAETLSDLALDMKDIKTFQLLVITHDQDFIDKLLHVDPVDYYFKVSRDQNGHSKIEKTTK